MTIIFESDIKNYNDIEAGTIFEVLCKPNKVFMKTFKRTTREYQCVDLSNGEIYDIFSLLERKYDDGEVRIVQCELKVK